MDKISQYGVLRNLHIDLSGFPCINAVTDGLVARRNRFGSKHAEKN